MAHSGQKELLKLTHQKDPEGIRAFLESLHKNIKGKTFEWYLAKLYKGNGWLTEIRGGRGDLGADILLYHPKTPSRVSLIVQAKNQKKPLTFDDTKIELIKFEEQAAPKYNCQQFNLVAINGFVSDAEKLSEFNMLLYGWEYVAHLIERYDPENITEPEIELYAHNKIAYEACKERWHESNYVAVVQATGTGKSYQIAKHMADFLNEKKLVMAPSNYILDQQQSKVPWATQSTTFMTYAKGANLTDEEIKTLDAKLIVLDEFHRCGAEVWGAGVQRILDAHPETYIFGTTATPIRYLDNSRDMSDELFGGVVAEDLSLAEAIVKRILPAPDYIATLYTLDEEIDDLMDTLERSKNPEEKKKEIADEIKQIKLDWEKSTGIPEILKKHLGPDIHKFIIFCKDQDHLDKMEVEVQRWFQKAGTHRWRKVYRVLSADPESDQNLEAFKNSQLADTAHLLFAIDMLNEGLHISDVGAVILLRPTESPIVFYQQIGRCIQVDVAHTPIIFDFVNNFISIRANDFLEDINKEKNRELLKRTSLSLEEHAPNVHITDETKEILEVFEKVLNRLQPFEAMYQHMEHYVEREGHARVPASYKTEDGFRLGSWVVFRRLDYRKNKLAKDKIKLLEKLPSWTWDPLEADWLEGLEHLKQYVAKEGHARVHYNYKTEVGFGLGMWVGRCRQVYKNNQLHENRIKALEKILGWTWDPLETDWLEGLEHLKKYVAKEGHARIPISYETEDGFGLGKWVSHRRQNYKNDKLLEDRIKTLEKIPGWTWDPLETDWLEGLEHLKQYVAKEGHARVHHNYKTEKGFRLGLWVGRSRQNYKNNKLLESRIKALEKIPGWTWDPMETDWLEGLEHLKQYVAKEGHARVHHNYKTEKGFRLGLWVGSRRQEYKNNKLLESRIEALEKIPGWTWDPLETDWLEGLEHLKQYVAREGHARVPYNYKTENGFRLGRWINSRRQDYKKGKLPEDRIRVLEKFPVWS